MMVAEVSSGRMMTGDGRTRRTEPMVEVHAAPTIWVTTMGAGTHTIIIIMCAHVISLLTMVRHREGIVEIGVLLDGVQMGGMMMMMR